jgi:hypothetical protein
MIYGLRTSCKPGRWLKSRLRVFIGHQRFVQNGKAKEAEYWRTFGRKALSLTGEVPFPDQAYSHLITESSAFLK